MTLSIYLSIKLWIYHLSSYGSINLQSTNQPISLPIYRFSNLPVYRSINLSIYQSTHLSIYQPTDLPIYHFTKLPSYRSINLSIHRIIDLLGGGFALPYRSFAYRCWFRPFLLVAVSSYPFVGSPLVLVLEVTIAVSEKSLEFFPWVSLVGGMVFD